MPILLLVLLSVSEMLSAKKAPSTRPLVRTVTKTSPKTIVAPPKIDQQPSQQQLPVQPPLVADELPPQPPDLFKMVRQQDLKGVNKLLADELVDINARNAQGDSALHIATSLGDLEMVRLLTDHGANVMLRDNLRRTASQRAGRHRELQNFLEERVTENCRYLTQQKHDAPARKKELEIIAEQKAKRKAKEEEQRSRNGLIIRGGPGWYGYGYYLKHGFPDTCTRNQHLND